MQVNELFIMGSKVCKKKCFPYKKMVNFPFGIPKYVIADQCPLCVDLWIPKGFFNRCFCCSEKLRKKRKNNSKHETKKTDEEIALLLEKHVEKGWTPLNKSLMDNLQRHKEVALSLQNNARRTVPKKEVA